MRLSRSIFDDGEIDLHVAAAIPLVADTLRAAAILLPIADGVLRVDVTAAVDLTVRARSILDSAQFGHRADPIVARQH